MSNSPLVTYTRISPNHGSRTRMIDTVTIHCTAGQGTAKSILNLSHFANYHPSRGCSCNYAIGYDGSIGLCVEEKDRSWCSSSSANDNRAITIEVSSESKHPYKVTDAAYNALIDLLVDICQRNSGIGTLKWQDNKSLIGQVDRQNMTVHKWFANKACPGEYLYKRHAQIAEEVNARLGGVAVKPAAPVKTEYTVTDFVKDVQKACGAVVDGIAGNETLSKTVTLSATINSRHAAVKAVQKRLYALGYTEVGDADGIAGSMFTSAVKHYQKDNSIVADGEITAKMGTWKKLLNISSATVTPVKETYDLKSFVKDIQKACGAVVDGIAGNETLSKTVTVSSKINSNHAVVKCIQKRLKELGYVEVGTIDGVAGSKFTSAVAHFQQDNGCVVDGEITAKKTTWKKLLGMA